MNTVNLGGENIHCKLRFGFHISKLCFKIAIPLDDLSSSRFKKYMDKSRLKKYMHENEKKAIIKGLIFANLITVL